MLKFVLASLVLGAAVLGCESSNQNHGNDVAAASAAPSTQAVTCSKCQVTWVKVPKSVSPTRVMGYDTRKSMECPDCRSEVQNFFATGKLEHTCKTCGPDAMEICTLH